MREAVDSLLDRRGHPAVRSRRLLAVGASLALHLLIVVGFVVAPVLAARQRPPIEFVPVRIVPVQALGVPEPAPPPEQPEPKPEPKPAPPPEPETRRPQPETRESPPPAAARQAPEPAAAAPPPRRAGSPEGSSLGTSPFGAVAGLDNPDFVYDYYIDQMLALIGSHWVRPPAGRGVEAVVRYRIGRQGEVTELELLSSSGHPTFDLAALRAVRLAAPLPPLPRSYHRDSLGVRLVIR